MIIIKTGDINDVIQISGVEVYDIRKSFSELSIALQQEIDEISQDTGIVWNECHQYEPYWMDEIYIYGNIGEHNVTYNKMFNIHDAYSRKISFLDRKFIKPKYVFCPPKQEWRLHLNTMNGGLSLFRYC